jgi:fimbrial isopeptide formation D2 family protein
MRFSTGHHERRERMHRKRQRMVLGMALLLAALLVLVPAAAALAQESADVPPTWKPPNIEKFADKECCDPEGTVKFTVFVVNPIGSEATWYNVEVVDEISSHLEIDSVTTSKGSYTIVGNTVTVDGGITLPPGDGIEINISCTVRDFPSSGVIYNEAYVDYVDPDGSPGERLYTEVPVKLEICTPFVPEASTIVLLGSAVTGLAGYIGLQIRARRRR